jgi:dTDP-4-amino-4,6-dideoxygalactose transaminase
MKVPVLDLKAQYDALQAGIDSALQDVLDNTAFALGPAVARFEEHWAEYCGTERCVAVNSGTDALHLALLAAGVQPGDEVITSPITFIATCEAICYCGATPVLVDIDPDTFCLRPDLVEEAVSDKTSAILPVHIFGQPADMDPIMETARSHGLKVIEDAAQAHGAEYRGRPVGSIGDFGCFSFYPTKNLGAFGEGGAVVTDDGGGADQLAHLRAHGQTGPYYHAYIGYNSRMQGFQGAVLDVKLPHLDEWNDRRREIAARYGEGLADTPLKLPSEADYARHVFHVYVTRCNRRNELRDYLTRAEISTVIHYPIPMHHQQALQDRVVLGSSLGEAEAHADEALSLPLFPEMSDEQVDYVIETVRAFFA